ncbi:MAG: NAD-dependent epimerase/dehydratase family protein, partial [Candidatus Omnitrophica bacterium]|nr:NAD-dependent epimerase/dehydratase family protein [Candidatus Omnitrophota bacterium]
MSNYLVTGGAGFIGSHVVENLLKRNHQVTIFDDFSTGKQENIPKFVKKTRLDVVKGSITNYKLLMKVLKGIDYVIHLAALVSVPKSIANPKKYNETNVTGTLKILLAVKENSVKKVVFASSSAVYGQIENIAIKEDCGTKPISPYGVSKLIGEYYCKLFSIIYALPTVSLRFFNVYGPRQSLAGQYASVIPKFITCMLEN